MGLLERNSKYFENKDRSISYCGVFVMACSPFLISMKFNVLLLLVYLFV